MQKITFTVDGQKLHGALFYPKKSKAKNPAILFLNGWRSNGKNAQRQAEILAELGFVCMTFTMRGHGDSEGDINTLTRQDFLNDALGAYDFFIKQKGVDPKLISVAGSSFGAYMAALMSRERNVANLVLRVPANYPNESFHKPQIEFSGDNNPEILQRRFTSLGKQTTFALDALHTFDGKIFIIQSEEDELIPQVTIENYLNACPDKKKVKHVVMKGADHSIGSEKFRVAYEYLLTQWFKDKV